ncbi:MAG: hypothetical protein KJ615_05525, partial [Bacteroidetes bacterium]|nr:hypothetical protein [Bacteroidota bacterium]
EDNMLQQELLVYQQECGRNIMNYTSTYHYNQAEGIIKSLMLNSRSKYELGHADKGSIPARIAKMNQNLRNIIYGSPGQMIYNILDIAGAAVANY